MRAIANESYLIFKGQIIGFEGVNPECPIFYTRRLKGNKIQYLLNTTKIIIHPKIMFVPEMARLALLSFNP